MAQNETIIKAKTQLRRHLEDCSKEELISLLLNISNSYIQAKEYLIAQFEDEE